MEGKDVVVAPIWKEAVMNRYTWSVEERTARNSHRRSWPLGPAVRPATARVSAL
jgi:hypothetical protein